MADTATKTGMTDRLRAFPKAFWVVNGIELLERGAYYSFTAVFFVFMSGLFQTQGMDAAAAVSLAGVISSVLFLLLYIVPVFGAPFTEKFGYKASLAVVFTLLTAGYLVSLVATGLPMIIAAVLLIGLGAGIFKPIPAAIVTQTSTEEQRTFGFSIYYACINIGAFVFPGAMGIAGIYFPDRLFQITFLASAALVGVNLLLSLFLFKNIREPQRDKDVLTAVKSLGEVFRHPAFLVLMVIYAGFWFMYALALTVLAQYMGDFGRMPEWFNPALLQTINPAIIILGAPLLAPIGQRFNPLVLMITGIVVYAFGLLAIGFSSVSSLFVMGVVLYSVGELLTHPAYLGYVSRIAPPDKATVFLGYGFIPVGVGQFLGSMFGSQVYASVAITGSQPQLYWALMASVGFLTAAAFLMYHLVMAKPRDEPPAQPRRRFAAAPLVAAVAVLLLVPAVVYAGSLMPEESAMGGDDVEPLATASLVTLVALAQEDETAEGETTTLDLVLPANATGTATLALAWEDEAAAAPRVNQPDTFSVRIVASNGTELAAAESAEGAIELTFPATPGDYTVEVTAVSCGDQTVNGPLGPLPVTQGNTADTGNAWTLDVSHQAAA